MDISLYFEPIDTTNFDNKEDYLSTSLGEILSTYTSDTSFPDLKDTDIAIIGVSEDRNAVTNEGCADGPDYVRNKLYQLYQGAFKVRITDLGNIAKGDKIEDTYFALSTVIGELIKEDIVPVIIGGSQDLT
ncbi:MAG TPA: arginase, partial [Flavobacteriales bacterium]|nr:arginase [Flavobacteriales bacterium]